MNRCPIWILAALLPAGSGFAQNAPAGGGTNTPAPPPATSPLPATTDNRAVRAPDSAFAALREKAARDGVVRVIVGLQVRFTPEGALTPQAIRDQRAAIAAARNRLTTTLSGSQTVVLRTYPTIPAIALSLSASAVDALRATGQAATIGEDLILRPTLANATKRIEATETTRFQRTGSGQIVAIIDTGVEASHPFLQQSPSGPTKVVAEACFTDQSCPNGGDTQTGPGAGAPCTFASVCDHGTHVAGIAAGRDPGSLGFNGVAPGANLVALQVFSNIGGSPGAFTTDLAAALDHVYSLATTGQPIAAVNMSLGGNLYTAYCDSDPTWQSVKLAIDNLASAGIATVAASGNDSFKAGVNGPACLSSAVAVGGAHVYSDFVTPMSNSGPQLDLLAINAATSSITGGAYGYKVGTSMATPQVAGAFAVLKQSKPSASVAELESHLKLTGVPITDTPNSITTPRIRLLAASVRLGDTGFVDAETFSGNGAMSLISNGVGLATRSGGSSSGTITIPAISSVSQVGAAYLYWMTLGGPDDQVTFRGKTITGTLIGASRNTCWPWLNPLGPNRVYRAKLAPADVVGSGSYPISGVGGTFGIDGQGASLVVIANPQYLELNTQRVIRLRHGAMTLDSPTTPMNHTFANLSIPKQPLSAELHVGMGDTEMNLWEDSMYFNGSPITSPAAFSGSDGPQWDAVKIPIPVTLLPAGPTSATNGLGLGTYSYGDCMAWAYSALSYKYKLDPPIFF